jgi:hypothetical protein
MNAATLSGPNSSRSMTPAMQASRLLGWVSFAIGAAELIAPRKVARAVGMDERSSGLIRAYGARELVAGVGAHSVYPVPALWSRVAGDLLDLGTLAVAARRPDGGRGRGAWIALATVAGITVIDALVASRLAAETKEGKGARRDYADRSGFPGGVEAARGAGIVAEAEAGKAGGAAAGDSSPAGKTVSGQSSTDLAGAPAAVTGTTGETAPRETTPGAGRSGFIGSGQTMDEDARKAVPEPPSYTPA